MEIIKYLKLYRKWFKIWGTTPVHSWVKAASCYKSGRFEKALYYYNRGLEKHPDHPASYCARVDLAYCMFKLGKIEEAKDALGCVIQKFPQSKDASLRLAKLQLWMGDSFQAALTVRQALTHNPNDSKLIAVLLMAVLENGGPAFLIEEAIERMSTLEPEQLNRPEMEIARALLDIETGNYENGRAVLVSVVSQRNVPIEGYLYFAEVLIKEERLALARRQLKKALAKDAKDPRVLCLLAETYLHKGPFYNADYAKQLATSASQNTNWQGQREMHVLAKAYFQIGDKMSALMIASQAKEAGKTRRNSYRDSRGLDEFIDTLTHGTLA